MAEIPQNLFSKLFFNNIKEDKGFLILIILSPLIGIISILLLLLLNQTDSGTSLDFLFLILVSVLFILMILLIITIIVVIFLSRLDPVISSKAYYQLKKENGIKIEQDLRYSSEVKIKDVFLIAVNFIFKLYYLFSIVSLILLFFAQDFVISYLKTAFPRYFDLNISTFLLQIFIFLLTLFILFGFILKITPDLIYQKLGIVKNSEENPNKYIIGAKKFTTSKIEALVQFGIILMSNLAILNQLQNFIENVDRILSVLIMSMTFISATLWIIVIYWIYYQKNHIEFESKFQVFITTANESSL